jgi:hypothetical protein
MINVADNSCTENRNTHFVFNTFYVENRAVYEIMWKNMVWSDRPQYSASHVLCMANKSIYKHALRICNTCYFSTATVVIQTRLNVALIRMLPVLFWDGHFHVATLSLFMTKQIRVH